MKSSSFLVILPFLLSFLASPHISNAAPPAPLTLKEAYQKALQQSEQLGIREQKIIEAKGRRMQALGTALPRLNLRAAEFIQDTPPATANAGGTSVSSTFTRRYRPEVTVTATQPIFQGLREFQALKVSRSEVRKNTFERDRAKQTLFFEVAYAYYLVLEREEEARVFRSVHQTIHNRTTELNRRIDLGKSRESEILTTQSELLTLDAELEAIKGRVNIARENLAFLIGEPVTQPLIDQYPLPDRLAPVETYLVRVDDRPDLKANDENVRLSKGRVGYEKGGLLPRVDATGNYYPYRVGFQSEIDWDVTFELNWPFFQGGAQAGRIKEAQSIYRQSLLANQEAKRKARTEIINAYSDLQSQVNQYKTFSGSERKESQNYDVISKEFSLGLTNNLEVLETLADLLNSRLRASESKYLAKLAYLQLLVASGKIPVNE